MSKYNKLIQKIFTGDSDVTPDEAEKFWKRLALLQLQTEVHTSPLENQIIRPLQ